LRRTEYFVLERREHDCLHGRKKIIQIVAFRFFVHIGHVDATSNQPFERSKRVYIMFASQLVNGFTFFGNSRQTGQTDANFLPHVCRHNLSIISRR
jgi:hypothetical protein